MTIPFEDSTALSYLAEFHRGLDPVEKDEVIANLSPTGQMVAKAILNELPRTSSESEQAYEAAAVLSHWAAQAASSR